MKRRGSTLIFLVLLLVGLFGIAALVIDIGYVRLERRRMLSASDGAALVGLQGRDAIDPAADELRRAAARDLVGWSLADDAQPVLSLNLENATEGDLVAGDWVDNAARRNDEADDYTRDDFFPNPDGAAFLVRLRRTSEVLFAGVGNPGQRIPYRFAYGSLLAPELRDAGIAARATSIAVTRRTKAAGRALAGHGIPGVFPLALRRDLWNRFVLDEQETTLVVRSTGSVELNGQVAGHVMDSSGHSAARALGEFAPAVPVADPAAWLQTALAELPITRIAYLPIVGSVDSGLSERIVGFAYIDALAVDNDEPGGLVVVRRAQRIASANTTAVVTRALDPLFTDEVPDPDLERLWAEHAAVDAPLWSAALSR